MTCFSKKKNWYQIREKEGDFFLKINKNVVQNKSLQHKQQFYQALFNVTNQIFVNKLLNNQLVDTKTFNCKVVQKRVKIQ